MKANTSSTPFSPPSGPPQRLVHEPPAKSKFLAAAGAPGAKPGLPVEQATENAAAITKQIEAQIAAKP